MENVNVSLEKAQATFSLKPGKKVEPQVLRQAVVDAGFTPRDIFVTVRGKLKEVDGKFVFQPVGLEQLFQLVENPELKKLKGEDLKEVGLVAKVIGEKPPLSLEIQQYEN